MYEQFYSYISKRVIEYFNENGISEGDRFYIQLELSDQVVALFETFKQNERVQVYSLQTKGNPYEGLLFPVGDKQMFIAASIPGVTEAFLTNLRNNLMAEFEKPTAILFICEKTLDSLTGATVNLQKPGMPLHNLQLSKAIQQQLQNDEFISENDQAVLHYVLNGQANDEDDNLFYYANVLEVLNKHQIEAKDYRELGLFMDTDLISGRTAKQVQQRLAENHAFFERLHANHRNSDTQNELSKWLDDQGVKQLEASNWYELPFKVVKASQEAKKAEVVANYVQTTCQTNDIVLWDKPKSEKKAGQRTRFILLFNPDLVNQIGFDFEFDNSVSNVLAGALDSTSIRVRRLPKNKIRINLGLADPTKMYFNRVDVKEQSLKHQFNICVVPAPSRLFKTLEDKYEIVCQKGAKKYLVINSDYNQLVFNEGATYRRNFECTLNDGDVTIDDVTELTVHFIASGDEEKDLELALNYEGNRIRLIKRMEQERPTVITGLKVHLAKQEKQANFHLEGDNRLVQNTSAYMTREDYRDSLQLEKQMVQNPLLLNSVTYQLVNDELVELPQTVHFEIQNAYRKLLNFYKANDLLPSLAAYSGDHRILAQQYLDAVVAEYDKLQERVLTTAEKGLFDLGVIYDEKNKLIYHTPLHPINIAYQLQLADVAQTEQLDESIQKLLLSRYLLPYRFNRNHELYYSIEQFHSPEWTIYSEHATNSYQGSRAYVAKLTKEKMTEFHEHFSYLFPNQRATFKVKAINLGNCHELLQGIFNYYHHQIQQKNKSFDDLIDIELYVYGAEQIVTAFEQFAAYATAEQIQEKFELTIKTSKYKATDLIDVMRKKVKYYQKSLTEANLAYSHITFYEMDQKPYVSSNNMQAVATGLSLNGLISGMPSLFIEDQYRSGFGTKFFAEENTLLKTAKLNNALAKAVGASDPFSSESSICTIVSSTDEVLLDKIYTSSHWVTFIDPKVDLNFFKKSKKADELLIIHYSDQYTSSSGYDAITVTRKVKQYETIISEFLQEKEVTVDDAAMEQVVNYFNAINGDWLLRLISSKSQFPREKLSILSAVKVALGTLYHPNIIWIPLSLEEVLRVSGGTGLSQSDGLFTVKNLTGTNQSYSDDLLLVGLEQRADEQLYVHFYPIEVKIGVNSETTISKAKTQIRTTKALLHKFLSQSETAETRIFYKQILRNFMMQLAIGSAEKLKLYNVWPEQNWDQVTSSEWRTKMLNDDYIVSEDLEQYIEKGAIISFKTGTNFSTIVRSEDVIIIELGEQAGYAYITTDLEELKNRIQSIESDLYCKDLLANCYKPVKSIQPIEPVIPLQPTIPGSIIQDPVEPLELIELGTPVKPTVVGIPPEIVEAPQKQMEIIFGTSKETSEPVIWYPTNTEVVSHTNTGIIGTMGTGKTQFTKSLITQLYQQQQNNVNQKPLGILIFDYKGDYIDDAFVAATNPEILDIFHLPFNPLALPQSTQNLLPLHTTNTLKETITKAFNLGPKQQQRLSDIMMSAYDRRGIHKIKKDTWQNQAPTLAEAFNHYLQSEDVAEDSLYAAINKIIEFELFEPDGSKTQDLFELIERNNVTVISLNGYDQDLQNLVVAITLDIFYSQMLVRGESEYDGQYRQLTKMILVDEADNFLSQNFQAVKKIMKEGRMFGVGTILSTQLLTHFDEYKDYISTWIVHNVTGINAKDIRYIFNTQTKAEEDAVVFKVKNLKKHESLVKLPSNQRPMFTKDLAFWELKK
ncbi:MAG: DNA phosphorothioation-dependent restriction protein DptH [Culicoidibacterales bacterium]